MTTNNKQRREENPTSKGQDSFSTLEHSVIQNWRNLPWLPDFTLLLVPILAHYLLVNGETYPITRNLYVIIRQDGRADEKAGVAYANLLLSREGQQFVEKAGLVPIREK